MVSPIEIPELGGWQVRGETIYIGPFWHLQRGLPNNITELELTTRKDDFADTDCCGVRRTVMSSPPITFCGWNRPVAIGGRVVDADGQTGSRRKG